MPRFLKYILMITGIFVLIFLAGIYTSRSVRNMGGLNPKDAEYEPADKDVQPLKPGDTQGAASGEPKAVKPENRLTVRNFLIVQQPEETGFGLYSYLLFEVPPTAETREKYQALLAAFLQKVSPFADIEEFVERKYLNVTYVPVTDIAPEDFETREVEQQVDWVLSHYNYARARVLLAAIAQKQSNGPFVYSVQNPLYLGTTPAYFLLQDFSRAPAHLSGLWLDQFIRQAAKDEFWEKDRLFGFVVNLRTAVAVLGSGVKTVSRSLDWWQKKMNQWIWIEKVADVASIPVRQ